jgi:hypothetical protein
MPDSNGSSLIELGTRILYCHDPSDIRRGPIGSDPPRPMSASAIADGRSFDGTQMSPFVEFRMRAPVAVAIVFTHVM